MNTFICIRMCQKTSVRAGGCRYVKAYIQRANVGILLSRGKTQSTKHSRFLRTQTEGEGAPEPQCSIEGQ